MTDEQLVSRITQTGGEKYATVLIKRYIPVISAKSAKMSLRCPSADKDDLFSEGLLGLLKAIRLYNSEKGASFVTFANLCTDSAMKPVYQRLSRIILYQTVKTSTSIL